MATTKAKSANAVKNNGGTVVNGGTVEAGTPITKNVNLNELTQSNDYGSKVVQNSAVSDGFSDPDGVTKAKTSGTFAYFPNARTGERNFLLKTAGEASSKINNVESNLLNIPGSHYAGVSRDSIHKTVKTSRVGEYATTKFDMLAPVSSGVVPGRTRGANAGVSSTFVQKNGSTAATDDAASPTRAVPGELTYHFGGLAKPFSTTYKAQDSYEA